MNHFSSIHKLDQAILYILELASSLSVLLLAFGLIASMANVLTKGSVLSDNIVMQRIWAWTQCIAIDASVAGTIIRTYRSFEKQAWAKFALYMFLSSLLLFTAAIVSDIESVQQTLNITLDRAYTHVFVSVEALIWVRSLVIVLLIVAHALRHVQTEERSVGQLSQGQHIQSSSVITPELLNELRLLLAGISVSQNHEEHQEHPQKEAETTSVQEPKPLALFPTITPEAKNKVIAAYEQGIQRREICAYLHWGSAKYTTIVKPVLDAYEAQQQQAASEE